MYVGGLGLGYVYVLFVCVMRKFSSQKLHAVNSLPVFFSVELHEFGFMRTFSFFPYWSLKDCIRSSRAKILTSVSTISPWVNIIA